MIERVRAVLITPSGSVLAIRRERPGQEVYWVLPGGHVDPGDDSLEEALRREIREEISGDADIAGLLHILEREDERQYFYLGRITGWSSGARTGPEFSEPGRGSYELDEIPLTAAGLNAISLKPAEIARLLADAAAADADLFALPDLRGHRG